MPTPTRALDPDPVESMLAAEAIADHAKAQQRGLRVLGLADAIASHLHARGMLLTSKHEASAEIFHTIADGMYGNVAIDIPNLREPR